MSIEGLKSLDRFTNRGPPRQRRLLDAICILADKKLVCGKVRSVHNYDAGPRMMDFSQELETAWRDSSDPKYYNSYLPRLHRAKETEHLINGPLIDTYTLPLLLVDKNYTMEECRARLGHSL